MLPVKYAKKAGFRDSLSIIGSCSREYAPVEEEDERRRKKRTTVNRDKKRGVPQGSPISPLLSNLYMRRFVLGWKHAGPGPASRRPDRQLC